jgi:general secretion pathway protein G
MTRASAKRLGFTLLEILIVIAIIGLLAAILFPVFASAREAARKSACLSNLRQLGQAMSMYTQDYDKYPHALDAADKYAPQMWHNQAVANGFDLSAIPLLTDALDAYVKNPQLWRCPSDSGFEYPDGIPWQLGNKVTLVGEPTKPTCFLKYGSSYFYRTELMFRHLSEDPLPKPAEINVLFDAYGAWHVPRLSLQKDKRYNVLFADGHVKNVNDQVMQAAWATPLVQ